MQITMLSKDDEVTLKVKVTKADVSDHSYYGEHARYKLEVLEGLEDEDGNTVIAEGLEWVEIRQPADGTVHLENEERKAKRLAREAEEQDEDGITEEDLDGLTVAELDALAEEHGIDFPSKARKADKQEILLNA